LVLSPLILLVQPVCEQYMLSSPVTYLLPTAAATGLFGAKPANPAPGLSVTLAISIYRPDSCQHLPSTCLEERRRTVPTPQVCDQVTRSLSRNLLTLICIAANKEGDQKPAPAGAASTTSLSSTVVAVPPPSMLRGKTIEEIVNRWTSDLEIHVKDFQRFAGEVAVWDRALIENGNNVSPLITFVIFRGLKEHRLSRLVLFTAMFLRPRGNKMRSTQPWIPWKLNRTS
jgi:Nsp1-like C-terminal region